MTLWDILHKQLVWSKYYPPEMIPSNPHAVLDKLKDDFGWLEKFSDRSTFEETYDLFVDRLFKLMMHLGQLTHHVDKENK